MHYIMTEEYQNYGKAITKQVILYIAEFFDYNDDNVNVDNDLKVGNYTSTTLCIGCWS